uniref:Uncharacterized protein n=3 Tax=Anaerobacillus isosaccharinicus TaxID=1532552 RepID=A0A1S2M9B2_9BACI
MNYKGKVTSKMINNLEDYKNQLEDGIGEMETMVDQLRAEIHDLLEKKVALEKVVEVFKNDLRNFSFRSIICGK